MKTCFKCGIVMPLSEFYAHPRMKDGHLNKCKSCTKNDTKDRAIILSKDNSWKERERARHRAKHHRLNYKIKHKPTPSKKKQTCKNYDDKYPEKRKARVASNRLKPNVAGNHLHRWSYNDEHLKDVIELKVEAHYFLHRHLIYDQPTKMYRRKDNGILLDSKEKHIQYFIEISINAPSIYRVYN